MASLCRSTLQHMQSTRRIQCWICWCTPRKHTSPYSHSSSSLYRPYLQTNCMILSDNLLPTHTRSMDSTLPRFCTLWPDRPLHMTFPRPPGIPRHTWCTRQIPRSQNMSQLDTVSKYRQQHPNNNLLDTVHRHSSTRHSASQRCICTLSNILTTLSNSSTRSTLRGMQRQTHS
jgi:hypothetical protein